MLSKLVVCIPLDALQLARAQFGVFSQVSLPVILLYNFHSQDMPRGKAKSFQPKRGKISNLPRQHQLKIAYLA